MRLKFLVGFIGAFVFAAISWFVLSALEVDRGWLTFVITGVATLVGYTIAQVIYDKVAKKRN